MADATVREGPGAELSFAVTLSRARSEPVTVDYATSDGTARAGSDYTETSGTGIAGSSGYANARRHVTISLTMTAANGGLPKAIVRAIRKLAAHSSWC